MNEIMKREMKEAIEAGERALSTLRIAQDKLKSASNWGLLDMIGGGFLSTMIKRSKMDDARSYMEAAKAQVSDAIFRVENILNELKRSSFD